MAEKIEVGVVLKGANKAATDINKVGQASKDLGGNLEGNNFIVDQLTGSLDQMTNGAFSGFKKAATGLKTFITGLKTTKAAIIATGIGALVVAFGLLVTYWDDIKVLVNGVSSEQKNLLIYAEATRDAAKEQLDITNQSEASLRLAGKSERDILNLKLQQTNEIILATEAILIQQREQKKAQVEAAERNQKITAAFIAMMNLPLTFMLSSIDAMSFGLEKLGLVDKATNLTEKANMWQASFIFDPEKVEEEGDAVIEETESALLKLRNTRDGFILQQQAADAAAEQKRIDDAQKAIDDQKALDDAALETQKAKDAAKLAAQIKLEDELYALSLSSFERAELALQQEFDKRSEIAGDNEELQKAAKQRLIDDLAALQLKADEEAAAAKKAADDQAIADQAEVDAKKIAAEEATNEKIRQGRASLKASTLSALSAIGTAQKQAAINGAKSEEEVLKIEEKFAQKKRKMAIATILLQQGQAMAAAITTGLSAAAKMPQPAGLFAAPGFVATAIGIALSSFASIKEVMNQAGAASAEGIGTSGGGVGGGGGGGGGGGLGVISNREEPILGLTPDMTEGVTPGSIPPINAYVVQSQLADQNALAAQIRTATTL